MAQLKLFAIRGKLESHRNVHNLLQLWFEVLSEQLETCHGKAEYTSRRIQNYFILIYGYILWDKIVEEVHSCFGLSLLADETVVIAGYERLSIGVCFVGGSKTIREFFELSILKLYDAYDITAFILSYVENYGFDQIH